jgi:hypothetical protein
MLLLRYLLRAPIHDADPAFLSFSSVQISLSKSIHSPLKRRKRKCLLLFGGKGFFHPEVFFVCVFSKMFRQKIMG